MGATPAWFLATVLLPEGCSRALPEAVFGQITETCAALGIELVGGHTEMTYGLERPIVVGAMLGEAERDGLIRPDGARPGDALILTKGIAIEGSAVLAREAADRLAGAGIARETIERAAAYLADPGISVVAEARAACAAASVHAMHDPTEGGLATALQELATACGAGLRVDANAIAVLRECRALCDAAGLDPLGLLASGALLIAVADEDSARVIASIEEIGVPAARIGSLVAPEDGVIMMANGKPRPMPVFARDEVARFLAGEPAAGRRRKE
jgi:hydrogenase maturation factor